MATERLFVTVGMSSSAHLFCGLMILCSYRMVTGNMSLSTHLFCEVRILCAFRMVNVSISPSAHVFVQLGYYVPTEWLVSACLH